MNMLMAIDYTAIGTGLAIAFVAFMQVWSRYKSDQNHKEAKKEITEVKKSTEEVRRLIDGPLGIALAEVAHTTEQLARIHNDPEMILKAVAARKLSDEHNAEQAKLMAANKLEAQNKAKIIEQFLSDGKKEPDK